MGAGVADRWHWLGRPFFVAAVVLLAVNDHVLKQRVPGWWTGKLSDFAGIVIAGTVASVLLGRGRGLVAAGVAFAVLKLLPGAPSLAAPLLGGITRRDPTDLLALFGLVPLAVWLRHLDARSARHRTAIARWRWWDSIRPAFAAALPVVASLAAIATATATACASRPAVIEIDVRGSTFFALVVTSSGNNDWSRSTDGARTWQKSAPPPGRVPREGDHDPYFDGPLNGPLVSCADDGTCFRLVDQRVIERRSHGGPWTVERRLTSSEFVEFNSGCAAGNRGILSSIGATGSTKHMRVAASAGANGVLVRTASGNWLAHPVGSARTPTYSGIPNRSVLWGLIGMGVVGIGLGLYGRQRWPSLRPALLIFAIGVVIVGLSVLGFATMLLNLDGHEIGVPPSAATAVVLVWLATTAVTIRKARMPKPTARLRHLPPPPAPPSPPPAQSL